MCWICFMVWFCSLTGKINDLQGKISFGQKVLRRMKKTYHLNFLRRASKIIKFFKIFV